MCFQTILAVADVTETGAAMLNLVGSLGSAAAAVTVVWIFIAYLSKREIQNEAVFSQVMAEKTTLVKDVTSAMSDVKLAVRENTFVTQRLEVAITGLSGSIKHQASREEDEPPKKRQAL